MTLTRRDFIATAASAAMIPGQAHAQDSEKQSVSREAILNSFDFEIIHRPEGFSGAVEQEIIFLIDASSSIDIDEIQSAVTGALGAIREHNYLANDSSQCPGSLGLGFIKFQSAPESLGYAILASNDDLQQVEAQAAHFDMSTKDNTGIGNGLILTEHMLAHTSQRFISPVTQRSVILIGDEASNFGPSPKPISEEIAVNHGATVHCIAMNAASDYEGIATQYKPSDERNGRWVDEGHVIEARTAAEIQNAILNIINQQCFFSQAPQFDDNPSDHLDHA